MPKPQPFANPSSQKHNHCCQDATIPPHKSNKTFILSWRKCVATPSYFSLGNSTCRVIPWTIRAPKRPRNFRSLKTRSGKTSTEAAKTTMRQNYITSSTLTSPYHTPPVYYRSCLHAPYCILFLCKKHPEIDENFLYLHIISNFARRQIQ